MSRLILLLLTSILLISSPSPGLLLPIGGGYSDIYAGFSLAAVANAKDRQVNILVLAPTYSSHPTQITDAERATNLKDAEERRFQIEEACKRAASPQLTCKAALAPIFTRADAENPDHLGLFSADLSAIFILGGDQTVGMQVIIGTPLEQRLEELHRSGVIIGGTSAGGGMLSKSMLAGYNPNYAAENSLFFGAADVWNTPEKHGLSFGLENAILDQHFYQRARFGRLLNAILRPNTPHIGVGVDAYTGIIANDEVLSGVFGLYTVTVFDAETYHAADSVRYISLDEARPPLLSARNILVHLLSSGEASYDLKNRQSSLAAPASHMERRFDALALPPGAGALILGGDLSDSLDVNPAVARFKVLGGENVLIVAVGYSSERSAQSALKTYGESLGSDNLLYISDQPLVIPSGTSGIVLFGRDQSKINPAALAALKDFWLSGKPILADNAAAALIGRFYSAHGPTPSDAEAAELATQKSFRLGKTVIQPGLGFLDITLEPQLLADNRFGRWFSLAYNHPESITLGLNKDTAIELSPDGAFVLGENGIFVLDLRSAILALGAQDGFVIANALLDIFAPGEPLQPTSADVNASYTVLPTPVVALPSSGTPSAPSVTQPPTLVPSPASSPSTAANSPMLPPIWGLLIGLTLAAGAALMIAIRRRRP